MLINELSMNKNEDPSGAASRIDRSEGTASDRFRTADKNLTNVKIVACLR